MKISSPCTTKRGLLAIQIARFDFFFCFFSITTFFFLRMYHSDAKFNRFGGLGRKYNVVQFKTRDKTSPSIIGIATKPITSCSSSSNSSVDPNDFPPPVKPMTVAPEETNIFDFPDTGEETLEVKLMVASLRAIPQIEKKPKKRVSPTNTPKSLSSTTNAPKPTQKSDNLKSNTKKPLIKVAALNKRVQPAPLSNQTNAHTAKNLTQKNSTAVLGQINRQQQWCPQQSQRQLMQHQRDQLLLQQQRERLILEQQIEQAVLQQQREQERERGLAILNQQRGRNVRQNIRPQQPLVSQEELSKKQQESSFDIFDFDFNPEFIIKRRPSSGAGPSYTPKPSSVVGPFYTSQPSFDAGPSYTSQPSFDAVPSYTPKPSFDAGPSYTPKSSFDAGPSYTPKLLPREILKKKRKRNVVAHLKTARGETTQPVYFDFLSDDEDEPTSDLLPLREIKERSRSPELTYAERMELQLEAMTQEVVIPTSESKRVEYKPQNQMKVKFTFSKK